MELDVRLLESFRATLLGFASEMSMWWQLPHELRPPESFRVIFSGTCFWSLSDLPHFEEGSRECVKEVFSDPDNPYDRVWHNKLAFMWVPNGDLIAFELSNLPEAPVLYLSHDGGEGHGYVLGNSFQDIIERWSLLGCPGNEDWQMMPFVSSPLSGLEPYGVNAERWREWFGLHVE